MSNQADVRQYLGTGMPCRLEQYYSWQSLVLFAFDQVQLEQYFKLFIRMAIDIFFSYPLALHTLHYLLTLYKYGLALSNA